MDEQSPVHTVWASTRDAPLSPLQQILLTTDGTVTHILEAYAGEAMRVVKLSQAPLDSTADHAGLGLDEHEAVLRRRILLRGTVSGTNLLYADSLIMADRLPGGVREGLMSTDKPIGKLLLENRTETFRDIVASGRERAADLAAHFAVEAASTVIFRTYHVLSRRRLVMRITEKFPATAFVSLPDDPRPGRLQPNGSAEVRGRRG